MKKIIIYISTLLAIFLISITVFFVVSPKPTAMLIYKLFEGGIAVKPDNYDEIEQNTNSYKDISYESAYKKGYLDIITPKDISTNLPVIFWIHGGAFSGGDKADITEYAVQIANEGYVVVNMNYELAPSANYPTPLYQINEAYMFILRHAEDFNIDMNHIYFAGDSAGAQIASQFVNIQVEKEYAELVGIKGIVPVESIDGVLLFCGPYDVTKFADVGDNYLLSFFLKRIGWAYIGSKDWINSDSVKAASVINYVSSNYPPTLITDGNTGSFEEQGMDLAKKLEDKGVFVKSIFYPKEEVELGHEYQFIMNTPQAKNTFNQLIKFLDQMKELNY